MTRSLRLDYLIARSHATPPSTDRSGDTASCNSARREQGGHVPRRLRPPALSWYKRDGVIIRLNRAIFLQTDAKVICCLGTVTRKRRDNAIGRSRATHCPIVIMALRLTWRSTYAQIPAKGAAMKRMPNGTTCSDVGRTLRFPRKFPFVDKVLLCNL